MIWICQICLKSTLVKWLSHFSGVNELRTHLWSKGTDELCLDVITYPCPKFSPGLANLLIKEVPINCCVTKTWCDYCSDLYKWEKKLKIFMLDWLYYLRYIIKLNTGGLSKMVDDICRCIFVNENYYIWSGFSLWDQLMIPMCQQLV